MSPQVWLHQDHTHTHTITHVEQHNAVRPVDVGPISQENYCEWISIQKPLCLICCSKCFCLNAYLPSVLYRFDLQMDEQSLHETTLFRQQF